MNDRRIILTGLGAFVVVVLFPFWWGVAAGERGDPPVLQEPTGSPCVMDREFMRGSHMELLDRWRNEVVREGERYFTAADGYTLPAGVEREEKSLALTCLKCHRKTEFCDRCHAYSAIVPNCWSCHVDPQGGE